MSSTEIKNGINTLTHEFDHVCRKLQATMIRHAAVGIGSCKIIKNINKFPYQETNSHKNEPQYDKSNQMTHAPSKDSDQPGHSPSLIRVFVVRMHWVLSYPLGAQ